MPAGNGTKLGHTSQRTVCLNISFGTGFIPFMLHTEQEINRPTAWISLPLLLNWPTFYLIFQLGIFNCTVTVQLDVVIRLTHSHDKYRYKSSYVELVLYQIKRRTKSKICNTPLMSLAKKEGLTIMFRTNARRTGDLSLANVSVFEILPVVRRNTKYTLTGIYSPNAYLGSGLCAEVWQTSELILILISAGRRTNVGSLC